MILVSKIHLCIIQNIPFVTIPDKKTLDKIPLALITVLDMLINTFLLTNRIKLSIICNYPMKISKDTLRKILGDRYQNINLEIIPNLSTYSLKDNLIFTLKSFFKLLKLNKFNRIDITYCLYPFSSILASIFFKIITFNKHSKIIYDIRQAWIENIFEQDHLKKNIFLLKIFFLIEKFCVSQSNGFLFLNNSLKKYYEIRFWKKIQNKPIMLLNSHIDEERLKLSQPGKDMTTDIKCDENQVKLGYIGSMDHWRKLDFLLDAISRYNSLYASNNLVLFMIGSGSAVKELEKKCKIMGLDKQVFFLGPKKPDRIKYYLEQIDIGLSHQPKMLATIFGAPLKVLEYLYFNKPVVASNVPAHSRLSKFMNGNGIFLYDFDINSFIRALLNALKVYNKLNVKEVLSDKFGLKQTATTYMHFFNLIQKNSKSVILSNGFV